MEHAEASARATFGRDKVPKLTGIQAQDAEGITFPLMMYLLYLAMEYMRPANPLGIPLVISIALLMVWLSRTPKIWVPQFYCFFALLAVIGVMGPFAENNYNVFMWFRNMGIELVCISIPLVHVVTNLRKFTIFANGLILVMVYLAVYAITHGGRGPGGHVGDENDVSLALNCAIPFAFLSIFAARTFSQKMMFGVATGLMIFGVVATMSRGGFLGLIAVLGYCFFLTPNKMRTMVMGLILVTIIVPLAPTAYWDEMKSIVVEAENDDPNQGTGALRREYWLAARQMFYANPAFGVGAGNFQWEVGRYQSEDQYKRLGRALDGQECHSVYFATLAELGAAGFGLFMLMIWYNIRDLSGILKLKAFLSPQGKKASPGPLSQVNVLLRGTGEGMRARRSIQGEGSTPTGLVEYSRLALYAHALRGGLLGFLVSGIFLSAFGYPPFWLLTGLVVALKMISKPHLQAHLTGIV